MNKYRTAAAVVAACLAGVSVTACQGGLTTPTASSSSPAASSPPASSPAAGTSSPAASTSSPAASAATPGSGTTSGSGSTVSLGGSLGSFPIPPGATVVENVTDGPTTDIVLSGVSASEVSSFYGSALPQAGYTVTENTNATGADVNGTAIQFTGHGDKGDIGAATSLGISGISGLSGLSGNIIGITLSPQ